MSLSINEQRNAVYRSLYDGPQNQTLLRLRTNVAGDARWHRMGGAERLAVMDGLAARMAEAGLVPMPPRAEHG